MGFGMVEGDESVLHRFRVLKQEKFSAEDLDDYLGADPKFFKMFSPFMHPVSKFVGCEGITVARETYVYEVDTDEWITHMDSLGFVRLEDERKKWKRPLMGEDLVKEAKPH